MKAMLSCSVFKDVDRPELLQCFLCSQDTVLDQKGDLEHMSNKLAEQEDQLRDKDNTIKVWSAN